MKVNSPVIREITIQAADDRGLEIDRSYRFDVEMDGRRYTFDGRLTAEPETGFGVMPDDEEDDDLARTDDREGVPVLLGVIKYLIDELQRVSRHADALDEQLAAEQAAAWVRARDRRVYDGIRPGEEFVAPANRTPWDKALYLGTWPPATEAEQQPTPARPGFYTERYPTVDITITGAGWGAADEEE